MIFSSMTFIGKGMVKGSMEKRESKGRVILTGLFDEGTFVEMGAFVRRRGEADVYDAILCGYGSINGKLTFAFAQDGDAKKGAFDDTGADKIERLYEQAIRNGAPVVGVFDSVGAVVYDGASALGAYGRLMRCIEATSGIVPQIAYINGVCSGMAAIAASMFDITVTVKDQSELYVTAPFVVGKDTGKTAYAEENGMSAVTADDAQAATAVVRELIGLLPANNQDLSEIEPEDDVNRTSTVEGMTGIALVEAVADNGKSFALWNGYGKEIVTSLVRVGGMLVGVIASDASVNGGKLTTKGARKAAHLVSLCDSFSIPVLSLVDSEGVDAIADPEQAGAFAKLASAYLNATCPKVTAVVGNAYGAAFTLMGSRSVGADLAFALPDAVISIMDPTSAVAFVWNDKITADKSRAEVEAEWVETYASAVRAAECGEIDDVVAPAELRQRICAAIYMLAECAEDAPTRKHGVMPL